MKSHKTYAERQAEKEAQKDETPEKRKERIERERTAKQTKGSAFYKFTPSK